MAHEHDTTRNDGQPKAAGASSAPAAKDGESPNGGAGAADAAGSYLRLEVGSIRMNVLVAGQGPEVLLVHGFPDTHAVWRHQIPVLVRAGYRVIAPDTRGCGDTDLSPNLRDYRLDNLVADLVALLDALAVPRVRLVGHDWGAVQGWHMAIQHPERVERYVAMSVGHPAAYAAMDLEQRLRGLYVLFFQLRGVAEAALRCADWRALRFFTGFDAEVPQWRSCLARPGRLSAGLNYYRANLAALALARRRADVTIPVHGIWSDGDRFLTEKQMRTSERYATAGWKYTRVEGANHWLQLDAPERVNELLLDCLH